jgi:hypothetical protein
MVAAESSNEEYLVPFIKVTMIDKSDRMINSSQCEDNEIQSLQKMY